MKFIQINMEIYLTIPNKNSFKDKENNLFIIKIHLIIMKIYLFNLFVAIYLKIHEAGN